jgi:uncharacterized protein
VIYEWNQAKAVANRNKHDISFEEAVTVFLDPLAITFADPDHSIAELREITIGNTRDQRLVLVCHCERGNRIRIISARAATRLERRLYEEGEDN